MKKVLSIAVPLALGAVLASVADGRPDDVVTRLPAPRRAGETSLEETLATRRSVRSFGSRRLTTAQIAQLLWAAQGTSYRAGRRTAPSAGALYPLETYVVTAQGLHHYDPGAHTLEPRSARDLRATLADAALSQEAVRTAPAVFVLTGVEARTAHKYGGRAERYVWMEAGHAAQNLVLQATALGLGGVTIGAFDDAAVRRVLGLPRGEEPLYLIPIGVPGT